MRAVRTDAETLAAAQRGDREALSSLLGQLLPRIRRTLARYAGTGPVLDDLTQEVLIAVAHGLPGFRGRAALTTWVHRICARTAFRRRRQGAEILPLEAARHRVGTGVAEVHAWVGMGRLQGAIDSLAPDRRTVFVLHDVEGHSRSEIAALLDIPAGTVSTRLRAARTELQGRLQPRESP